MSELINEQIADLALYAKVVEAGGFTAASKALGVPQATVSRRVADLERRLNVRLLERTTRIVSVTVIGSKIYQHARRIREEADGAVALAASLREEPSGIVRVTAPVVFGQYLLSPAIAQVLSGNPKIQVQVELTGRLVDLVEEGFDIAIRVGALDPSSLIKIPLMKANACYFANPDVAAKLTNPSDFEKVPWLHAGNQSGLAKWQLVDANTLEQRHAFEKEPLLTSSDVETLIQAAEAGLGIAVLPDFTAPSKLRRVFPGLIARQVEINALVVSHKSIIPSVRVFLDELKRHLTSASCLRSSGDYP